MGALNSTLLLLCLLLSLEFVAEVCFAADAAFDLNVTNFKPALAAVTSQHAIVEFYAHWCPACQNYKPHYERVAQLFNGKNAPYHDDVYMARVDCGLKVNYKLCDRFNIAHFPTLLWGLPSKFCLERRDSSIRKDIEDVGSNGRTAESLLQWINNKTGKAYVLDGVQATKGIAGEGEAFDPVKVAMSLYDMEESTAMAMEIILGHELLKGTTRAAFIQFLQLLVVSHPSKRCRKGAGEFLMNLEYAWPYSTLPDYSSLKQLQICGDGLPQGNWVFCHGSLNDTRGYSCGLWLLFHALSVRVEDDLASISFQAICHFVSNFFNCGECREHFSEMCSRENAKILSCRDLVLWLWRAHNEVNARLRKEERVRGTGDPKFPKYIWPSKKLCQSCNHNYSTSKQVKLEVEATNYSFDENEVYFFLTKFYGHSLFLNSSSLPRVEEIKKVEEAAALLAANMPTPSVVIVPLGAALAVAIASFCFGGIACLWRMQQKKRKQMRVGRAYVTDRIANERLVLPQFNKSHKRVSVSKGNISTF